MIRLTKVMLLLLLLMVTAAASTDVLDYEKRIVRGIEQIERIDADDSYADEGVDYLRKLLPATEQVEFDEKLVTVDNRWLHSKLDEFEAERTAKNRENILKETSGRLSSLRESIASGQHDSASDDTSAREKMLEILSRAEYREKPESWLAKTIRETKAKVLDFLYDIYQRIAFAIFGAGKGAGWFFKGVVIAALIFALVLVVRMFMNRAPRNKREKTRTVLGEEIEEGTSSKDLADAAIALARTGDFRAGVRKLYIALLYELAERNLIELSPDTTNHEYLQKVSPYAQLIPGMRYLTERFDYFWYGMFSSTEEDFSNCLARYREVVRSAESVSPMRPA